jgi:hypothetical protein
MAGELVHAAGAEDFGQVVGGLFRHRVQLAFAEGFGLRDARFDQVAEAVLLVVGGRQRIAGRVPPELVESVHVAIGLLRLAERADELFVRLAHRVAGVQRKGVDGGFAELIQVAVVVVATLVTSGFAPGGAAEVLQSWGFFALLPLVGQATVQKGALALLPETLSQNDGTHRLRRVPPWRAGSHELFLHILRATR